MKYRYNILPLVPNVRANRKKKRFLKKHVNVSWVSGVNVSFPIIPTFIMVLLRERNV